MLKDIAKSVWANAYAPYSKFKVGVAIKTIDGSVFPGVNVENVRKQRLLRQCVPLVKERSWRFTL